MPTNCAKQSCCSRSLSVSSSRTQFTFTFICTLRCVSWSFCTPSAKIRCKSHTLSVHIWIANRMYVLCSFAMLTMCSFQCNFYHFLITANGHISSISIANWAPCAAHRVQVSEIPECATQRKSWSNSQSLDSCIHRLLGRPNATDHRQTNHCHLGTETWISCACSTAVSTTNTRKMYALCTCAVPDRHWPWWHGQDCHSSRCIKFFSVKTSAWHGITWAVLCLICTLYVGGSCEASN